MQSYDVVHQLCNVENAFENHHVFFDCALFSALAERSQSGRFPFSSDVDLSLPYD